VIFESRDWVELFVPMTRRPDDRGPQRALACWGGGDPIATTTKMIAPIQSSKVVAAGSVPNVYPCSRFMRDARKASAMAGEL